ncbi:hypothetical protein CHS0354_019626 [Potamilus streckersoni]|uniref:Uncharacterized protein n=1 Tax=Potamilus streckersoni TaxID=2493646 RepID=A0AAE0T8Y9_9BIVA|nr:hypothetical protein CHS0354_019626 [Potamilus streckersoni]
MQHRNSIPSSTELLKRPPENVNLFDEKPPSLYMSTLGDKSECVGAVQASQPVAPNPEKQKRRNSSGGMGSKTIYTELTDNLKSNENPSTPDNADSLRVEIPTRNKEHSPKPVLNTTLLEVEGTTT